MRLQTLFLRTCGIVGFLIALSFPIQAASNKDEFYRALEYYYKGDYVAALSIIKAQLKKSPNDPELQKWMALMKAKAEENPSGAGEAVRLAPAASPLLPALSAAALEPQIPFTPPAPPTTEASTSDNYDRGINLYIEGRYAEAVEVLERYLAVNPDHIAARQWVALARSFIPDSEMRNKPAPLPATPQATVVDQAQAGREKALMAEVETLRLQLSASRKELEKSVEKSNLDREAKAAPPSVVEVKVPDPSLKKEIEALRTENSRLSGELAKRKAAPPTVVEVKVPDPEAEQRQTEFLKLKGQLVLMTKDLETLRAENSKLSAALAEAKAAPPSVVEVKVPDPALEMEIEALRGENAKLSDELAKRKAAPPTVVEVKVPDPEAEQRQTEFLKLKGQLVLMTKELAGLEARLRIAEEARRATESRYSEATGKLRDLETLRGQVAEMERLRALLQESRAQALRLVLDIRKERELRKELETGSPRRDRIR